MKRNVKILAGALITAISATSIGVSFADNSSSETINFGTFNKKFERQELTTEQKTQMEEIKVLMDKQKDGVTLTADEQEKLDTFKANMPEKLRGFKGGFKGEMGEGKSGFMHNLTTEEKTALETMGYDEKKVFFEAKKLEMDTKREFRESVIDKLLAGETLTADEEIIRADIIKERALRKARELEEKSSK